VIYFDAAYVAKCYLNEPRAGPRLARTHRRKSNDVFSFFGQ